jgi:hypothetical protein
VSGQSEEDVWRSIVENYGERPQLDPTPVEEPDAPVPPPPLPVAPPPDDGTVVELEEADDRFVPPPPPPLPHPPPVRLAAWVGLFGSPAVLLVALVAGITLPPLLGYALVGAFLGGFGYLVVTMQRGPRDPGDDGARI